MKSPRIGMLLLFFGLQADVAAARDLQKLAELLTPAYIAMDYAGLCVTEPGWAAIQPVGARGTAIYYAQHIKDEIIASLSYPEAVSVLRHAADSARDEARSQLREHVISLNKVTETQRFREWCEGPVNVFIREVIVEHDLNHRGFMERVRLASSEIDVRP
jgi:hypothetical protein